MPSTPIAIISSKNFAGFASLHNFPSGKPKDNHWGPAISVFETTSQTAYYFNFHQADLGNFTVVGPSGSGKTTTLYGEDGNVSKIVDPVGREISYRYDLANRQAWLTDAGGRTAVERHDIAGRPVLTIDASGNQVARSYHGDSALGQLKSVVVTPGGSTARTVTLAYDTIGRLNKVTDTAGNTSLTTYDGLGRRYRVIGPVYTDGTSASQRRPVTRYAYDAWGRTASVSQGYTTFTTDAQAVTDTADSDAAMTGAIAAGV